MNDCRYSDSQFIKIQRTNDCGVLGPRWDIYIRSFDMPREPWRRGDGRIVEEDACAVVSSGNDGAVSLIHSQQLSVYPRPHKINLANNLHGLGRGFQGSIAPKCSWGRWLLEEGESVFFRGVAAGRLPMFHLVNYPAPMPTQAAPSGLCFFLSGYKVERWVCIRHLVEVKGWQVGDMTKIHCIHV